MNHSEDGVHSPINRAARCAAGRFERLRERPDDQRLRDTDAQLAGQQLEQNEPLEPVERWPPRGHARVLFGRRCPAKRQQALLDPCGQRQIGTRPRIKAWQLIQHQRGGLGRIADNRVALVDHPGFQPGGREHPVANGSRRHDSFEATSGEKEHGPCSIGCRRRREGTAPSPRPSRWSTSSDRALRKDARMPARWTL